jgi:type I restriction-modification system DNA methylase subunit
MNISLQQRIDKIFDHLYAESKVKNPESIAYEFSKILHTGLYIEKKYNIFPAFKDYFPFDGIFSNKDSVNELRKYFEKMNDEWSLYPQNEKIKFSDNDINYVCGILFDLVINQKDNDILGDAIEIFRNYSIKSLGGQFFTDSTVTKLALDILNYNALKGEKFIDICSGTGGFILAAINKTKHLLENNNIFDEGTLAHIVLKQVQGKEIDKTIADAGNRNIQTRIGLKFEYINNEDSLKLKNSYYNSFDCIATNPPFGTKTTVKDYSILEKFELAKLSNASYSPTSPDILFLEQNIKLLKPEIGKMAIVLPYQLLSGPKARYIRKWLLQKCIILAVIDLPAETFQPHTGTKTSLLVIKKRSVEDINLQDTNYNIFMSKPNWIGHDRRGNTVFKKNIDGSISNEILCDFSVVENDWYDFTHKKEIKSNISFLITASNLIKDNDLHINALYYSIEETTTNFNESVSLKNVVKNIFYPGRFKRNYVTNSNNAVPFLGGSNITEHVVSTKKYISKSDPHFDQLVVHTGWLLITRSGTTGIVSMVPKEWDGYAISEHVIRIIPDPTKEDPFFLYAFLQTESAQRQISRSVFGSVIDEINPNAIGNIRIPLNIDHETKSSIIASVKKYEEARDISLKAYRQALTIMQQIA